MSDPKDYDLDAAPTLQFSVSPSRTPEATTTARTVDENFLSEQRRIEKMIVSRAPLKETLTDIVLLIESQVPEMTCSILLLSQDGDHVKHAVAPNLSAEYVKVIDGSPIGPKHGSCGAAMWRGKPVIVTDIATDPLWDEYRSHALAIGMVACWSTPILSSKGKVLGSFAMYYRAKRGPDDYERQLTDIATKLSCRAIETTLKI